MLIASWQNTCWRLCLRWIVSTEVFELLRNVRNRDVVLTTEDAEKTEESQKYAIAFFRVVRVFRGYQSRWLRAGCSRNQLMAILAAQKASTIELTQLDVDNLYSSKSI